MFASNLYYGNATVLAAFARKGDHHFPRTIPGAVQPDLTHVAVPSPWPTISTFVWGPAALAERRRLGLRHHTPIGAPWLYLLEMEKQRRIPQPPVQAHQKPKAANEADVLYFPEHGLAGAFAAQHQAAQVAERFAGQEVTVALTHEQFASSETVQAYRDAGLVPVDLGPAVLEVGSIAAYQLLNVHLLLRAHQSVLADSPGQFALFAHAAGVETHFTGFVDGVGADAADPDRLDALVDYYLGRPYMLTASEMRALFDWNNNA